MSVQFRAIDSAGPVVEYLTHVLRSHLALGQRVLWLVAGGSSMPVAVAVSKNMVESGIALEKLAVTLTDERYGDVGHADSNWLQLQGLGFDLPGAELHPVLEGKDMAATVADFGAFLSTELAKTDYCLGLFGIGADGHTAGILPRSSAINETLAAHGYDAAIYKRITMTPAAIVQLDEAVAYAVGESKWPVLDQLETELSVYEQPAQILKHVPVVTIFTDKERVGNDRGEQ